MEQAKRIHTAPIKLHGAQLADYAIQRVDQFFELEERTSEEDKLRYGLQYGVEHGFLTEEDAIACERAFLETRDTQG